MRSTRVSREPARGIWILGGVVKRDGYRHEALRYPSKMMALSGYLIQQCCEAPETVKQRKEEKKKLKYWEGLAYMFAVLPLPLRASILLCTLPSFLAILVFDKG